MASTIVNGGKDICATCKRWNGVRKINRFRDKIEYDTDSKGECINGGRNRRLMNGNARCDKWEKWELLMEKKYVKHII